MLDRTIGGLLANDQSPFFEVYRTYTPVLFPSGLEATHPGKDIILILNSEKAIVNKDRSIDIPLALKNPEKGVAQIIGHGFARKLFLERGAILIQLIATDGAGWVVNAIANADAQLVLENYNPYQTKKLSHISKTGIEFVKTLLNTLPEYRENPRDAMREIDWTIGELLAGSDSPSYHAYLYYIPILFPSGLEATLPGNDIILILNSEKLTVIKKDTECSIDIPSALKNPEKRVAQIIGHLFARTLFMERGKILNQLIATDENGADWQVNGRANEQALSVLKQYNPYPGLFDKPIAAKSTYLEQLFPCMRLDMGV